jgi:hypothetical protein
VSGLVRIHGATSQGYPKKSYALTLETPVPWLGMRASAQWVLNAAFVDRSLMRHKLSYDLFRSLSAAEAKRYAAASRFVEVHLNGEYNGAYLLMERVDRALLELRSYDATRPAPRASTRPRTITRTSPNRDTRDTNSANLTRLLRFIGSRWTTSINSSAVRLTRSFTIRRKASPRAWTLDNAIDFQLLVLLTSNLDGITKNFILARDAVMPDAPAPRFFFAPWDYDATFGRNWDARRVDATAWLSNHLFDRLHGSADFRKKFAGRWKQLREREFSVATIHRLIDDNARTLGDAAQRNATRWRTLDGPYPDRLTFEDDLAQMKAWAVARVKWLDAEIDRR